MSQHVQRDICYVSVNCDDSKKVHNNLPVSARIKSHSVIPVYLTNVFHKNKFISEVIFDVSKHNNYHNKIIIIFNIKINTKYNII